MSGRSDENLNKCIDMFVDRDYAACVEATQALFATGGVTTVFVQLYLISLQRLGEEREVDRIAPALLGPMVRSPWDHGLLLLTLGRETLAGVLARAGTAPERCQAHYYAGARLATLGRRRGACPGTRRLPGHASRLYRAAAGPG